MTLTDFLLARIAEDEAVATEATEEWQFSSDEWRLGCDPSVVPHIARHDPARILAECGAKRRIVELHAATWVTPEDWWSCVSCGTAGEYDVFAPCPTLRALASVYRDHPDWSASWD